MSQHKATRRTALRSALAHRRAADTLLEALNSLQTSWNATMDKLNADTGIALDTDYEASALAVSALDPDAPMAGSQSKATLRQAMRSALAHKKAADELVDAIAEVSTAYSLMLVKLDAEGGTLSDPNWELDGAVEPTDPDAPFAGSQSKASLRQVLRSALANKKLADDILGAITGLQDALYGSLVQLDSGNVGGAHAAFKVTVIEPDA